MISSVLLKFCLIQIWVDDTQENSKVYLESNITFIQLYSITSITFTLNWKYYSYVTLSSLDCHRRCGWRTHRWQWTSECCHHRLTRSCRALYQSVQSGEQQSGFQRSGLAIRTQRGTWHICTRDTTKRHRSEVRDNTLEINSTFVINVWVTRTKFVRF